MSNLLDYRFQNQDMQQSLKASIEEMFPLSVNGRTLKITNVLVKDILKDTDFPGQKETKLQRGDWAVPVTADIALIDDITGRTISSKEGVKIGAIPKITNRLSAIVGGNEYQVFNQIRRRPGVFSRQKKNGELQSEFNLSKGANFSLELDPSKEIFYFKLSAGTRKYRLYTLLSALGKLDSEMIDIWGQKLFDKNKKGALNTEASELSDIHKKVVKGQEPSSLNKVISDLKDYFERTEVNGEVTEITLGKSFEKANADTILAASAKLLSISKGEAEQDNRDSLIFKDILTPSDLLSENFKANTKSIQAKLKNAMRNRENVREIVAANTFTKPINRFFTTSDLSSTPPQTNPIAMATNGRKTTSMGEGGIQNSHAITMETRDVQPSQFGFLDPLATPESLKVGTTVGLTIDAQKRNGKIVTPVRNSKTGEIEYKSPIEIHKKTIGFPDEYKMVNGKPKAVRAKVKVLKQGEATEVSPEEVDFYLKSPSSMFDFSANLIPFLSNTQGNRGSTASRMLTQALPLDNPDVPLTLVKRDEDTTFEQQLGTFLLPTLDQETKDKKLGGVVTGLTDEYVTIKADNGKSYEVGLYNQFPLNQDGFLHSTPVVNIGDRVGPKQILAKSNYTDNEGILALGKNLTVGYVSYKGNSFEDAATITESAAKKLSHTTIDKINIFHTPKISKFDLKRFRANYPDLISPSNARKLDSEGLPKVGQEFQPNEVLAAFLVKKEMDDLDQALKRLDKTTYTPYAKNVTVWDEDDPGIVTDVRKAGRNIDIYVKSVHPFKEGDKLSSRYGDKHIVGKIIPDDEAPHRPDGTPLDIMVNPQGVQGRMNMGQLLDTAAGKIALKRGEPYKVYNFADPEGDAARDVLNDLKAEGLEADEVLLDGKGGKPLKNKIFVGNRNYVKLRHLVKKKLNAHDTGVYDIDEQPAGKGAQKIGVLDTYAILAHGSKNLLREATEVKGRKNEEYFRNLQFGLPPGRPNNNFMFDKMLRYFQAAGVDVRKEGNRLQLMPLTDAKTEELSSGALEDPGAMLIGKNLGSRKGGLFDPEVTGGAKGDKYSHIDLGRSLPNPMAELAIKSILGLTNNKYDSVLGGKDELNGKKGPQAILDALKDLDIAAELEKTKEELKEAPKTNVNKLNTKVRILDALDKQGMRADEAYSMSKLLVIPPKFRPVYALPSGDLQVSDINKHYRDVGLAAKGLNMAVSENLLTEDEEMEQTKILYNTIKATQGFIDPVTYGKQKYKGALKDLGDTKRGLIFGKAWAKRQDLSGRSTITPEPSLGIDEVGIPEPIARKIYKPFMIKDLKSRGLSVSKAKQEVEDFTPLAKSSLEGIMRNKPVILNRAPSLHKHSVQAFKPTLTTGKKIRLNPIVVSGFNADFDGDSVNAWITMTYDFENCEKRLSQKLLDGLKNNVDFDSFSSYLSKVKINLNERLRKMIFNDRLLILNGNLVKNIHIKDFPHTDEVLKDKENIKEYVVPDFIKVLALNEGAIRPMPVTAWSIHENLEMFEVKLQSGKTVKASSDHSLICYDPNSNSLEKVKPVDSVGMITPIPASFKDLYSNNPKTEDEGYFIGAMVGDGWTNGKGTRCFYRNKNQIMLANSSTGVTQKVASFLNKGDGYSLTNVHDFKEHASTSTKTTWSHEEWADYLRVNIGQGAKNKKLPDDFLTSGKKYIYGLISGLIDTDGSVTKVKAKAKKHPQYQANYTTISEELHYQIQQLFAAVGVRTGVNTYERNGNTVYHISISMVDLIKIREHLNLQHEGNAAILAEAMVTKDDKDIIPISLELAGFLQKYIDRLKEKSLYAILSKAKKTGYILRSTAIEICKKCRPDNIDFESWKTDYVYNRSLYWEKVKSIEPIDETTAWDITVPGPWIFMTSNLITVQDTMSVMVPVTYEGEQDALNMIPSKNLFKHGDNGLVPSLSQEYAFGISKLSEIEEDTGKSFRSIIEAKREISDMNKVFTLNGQKMTLGQWELNKVLPEKYKDYTRVFKRKDLKNLLNQVAKTEDNQTFSNIINHYKDLGALYAYEVGGTISIEDMVIDRSYRDDIIKEYKPRIEKIKNVDKRNEAYMAMLDEIKDAQDKALLGKNRMLDLIETGALSATKAGNVRQVLTAPGMVVDTKGKMVPIPILKSYSEGLDSASYFNTLPGVRKGTVDKSVNTRESGALNKILLSVNRRLLITEEDCYTSKGLTEDIDDKNLMGRTLLYTIPNVGRAGEIIDTDIVMRAKMKKLETLEVRSPLTCKTAQGLCAKCYGALPTGQLPSIGTNVGILESQALTERSTQLTMQSFHTGGAAKKGKDIFGSFGRLEQLLKVPNNLSGKATLALTKGRIENIEKNDIGGHVITVGGLEHIVSPGRTIVVEKGNKVEKGDRLSDGIMKPQDIAELKDFLTAQKYIVDEISEIYGGDFHKKTMETVIRGTSDNAVIVEAPENSNYFRGDRASASFIDHTNEERLELGLDPIKYNQYFKSVDTLNVDNDDWMTRVTTNRVKDGLSRGMAKMQWADIAGNDPIPAYLYGDDFGKPNKKRNDGKGFY